MDNLLREFSKRAILVGSAARGGGFRDLDFLVRERDFKRLANLLPKRKESCFPLHWKTYVTEPPIEMFVVWYGPTFEDIPKVDLIERKLFGLTFRAWPGETRKEKSCQT